ncbi:hypothetical protein DUI87_35104 [Hirundo rustica rustica]|uniref:RNA-directed DNA polymerase n=1 Tax=Hirundo rustica rustica TaxID=333673 RepID=A0A3M0J1R4_HIRRU|nr:hypothetical protein DUI87_35104 [Hirundo rustica rustica]
MTLDESVGLEWGSVGLGHSPVGLRGSNPCLGLHTLQEVSGCHLLSQGSVRGSHRLGCDGREFLSIQPGSERFVVAAGAAQVTRRRWEHEEIQAEKWTNPLGHTCLECLRKSVRYGREALEPKGQSIAWVFPPNAHTLQKQFQLTATEAREIVESCDDCHALGAPLLAGVNPRGLKALELWQTDVTHVTEFGRLKYVHVMVDTFSSAMWASAHAGEKARDVIAHWRQAFAVLGIPSAVKTDSGPAYASQKTMGHAGYLQSVSVLTCDCRGRIQLTGKVEAVINLKATKWMNPRVFTLMIPPQTVIEFVYIPL